jgi:hypothetical protein
MENKDLQFIDLLYYKLPEAFEVFQAENLKAALKM